MAGIIAAGALLRILFALFMPTEQLYDFATYLELARNINNGLGHTLNGIPVAWQGPLYPYVLGFFFRITLTDSEIAAKVLNIILSSLTLILSERVYSKLFKSKGKTAAAVAITAFLPANIAYVNVLGTEVLFVFLLMLIFYLHLSRTGIAWYAVVGILTGLAALTKPFMLVFPAALALVFWFQSKKLKQTAIFAAVVAFAALLTVSPWMVRNWRMFGRFIPVSYNAGYVRYINNNDHNANGLWMDLTAAAEGKPEAADIAAHLEDAGEAGVKAAYMLEPLLNEASGRWMRQNPFEFLKLGFLRVHTTFFGGGDDLPQWAMNAVDYGSERDKNAVEAALGIILAVFSAVSFVFAFMQIKPFLKGFIPINAADVSSVFFFVFFVFFVVVIFISEGQARYAFPVYPLMIYAFIALTGGKRGD
ncbi:MAG: glycosyltransferase family 39 protein [Defluviitaleaceae bacterium]|nr:glycosyltransferase family 39 protein [Defluviitaleaceae bacterium]